MTEAECHRGKIFLPQKKQVFGPCISVFYLKLLSVFSGGKPVRGRDLLTDLTTQALLSCAPIKTTHFKWTGMKGCLSVLVEVSNFLKR